MEQNEYYYYYSRKENKTKKNQQNKIRNYTKRRENNIYWIKWIRNQAATTINYVWRDLRPLPTSFMFSFSFFGSLKVRQFIYIHLCSCPFMYFASHFLFYFSFCFIRQLVCVVADNLFELHTVLLLNTIV